LIPVTASALSAEAASAASLFSNSASSIFFTCSAKRQSSAVVTSQTQIPHSAPDFHISCYVSLYVAYQYASHGNNPSLCFCLTVLCSVFIKCYVWSHQNIPSSLPFDTACVFVKPSNIKLTVSKYGRHKL